MTPTDPISLDMSLDGWTYLPDCAQMLVAAARCHGMSARMVHAGTSEHLRAERRMAEGEVQLARVGTQGGYISVSLTVLEARLQLHLAQC